MDNQFVSRGGTKLDHALKYFDVDVKGKTVLDVGSSTGGFVDCLLQHGAEKVYSLDTAYGELAYKLRIDPRVKVIERTNILELDDLPELVDLVTIDVTFTSLTKILPKIKYLLKPDGRIIALVKPQYENQREALKNKGVIPEHLAPQILEEIISYVKTNGFEFLGQTISPIHGTGGNLEYLIYLQIKLNENN